MIHPKLQPLLAKNLCCADCDLQPVTHISVQNGVTLCQDCATLHSENLLRESTSWVRPLTAQNWRDDQLRQLVLGGNDKFNDFMSGYDLYTEVADKYNSAPA